MLLEHPHCWIEIWIGHTYLEPLENFFGHLVESFLHCVHDFCCAILQK